MARGRKTTDNGAARGTVYNLDDRRRERAEARAKEHEAALKAVRSANEVREEKIAELKARIASGQYNPDPAEIARKLLERGF